MPSVKRVQNIPAFDGFRGIGVFIVVLSHLPQAIGSGLYNSVWTISQDVRLGYICLDIFFAVSGFFITRLLLAEREATGSISLVKFYKRRIVRIFPIYYLSVVACYFLFQFGAYDTASLLTYTFNFYHPLYPTPNPLEHTWSLSVEEQFYVVWPLLIMVLPSRWIAIVTGRVVPAIAIACGLAISAWFGTHDQLLSGNLVYMLPFTRMLSLSMGGWLATREFEGQPVGGRMCLALTAIAIIILGLERIGRSDGMIASQGLYWTIALACYASLSIAFCSTIIFGRGYFARWFRAALSFRPLRALGRISYGVYLYHLPVLFYFGLNDATIAGGKAPLWTIGLASAIVLGLGIVSYRVIEQPLLSLRKKVRFPKVRDILTASEAAVPPEKVRAAAE